MRKIFRAAAIITITAILTAIFILAGSLTSSDIKAAGGKKLAISQAVTLAIGKSREYKSVRSKIFLKQAEYENAIKSIALKKKNMSTFRWTPLLSFKFPEKPTLADEYEYTYKPLQIQSEISSLKHQLTDIKYGVKEEVLNLYTDIYTYQETIKYRKSQLSSEEETLKKNRAKLAAGAALKSDIEASESSIETLKSEIALKERELSGAKKELSELIGIDVTAGYEFEDPYKEVSIGRDKLSYIEEQTLKKCQSYYDAKLNAQLALISLNTNYSLMRNQYGNKMSYISSFVTAAKNGGEVDSAEFKLYYNRFLTAIDSPWQGKKRILFIRIPREWFKGKIDGVRYVEDDPYALYTAVLEYQEAESERKSTEKDIRKQVDAAFENAVTTKNTYESLVKQTELSRQDMEKGRIKNKAGELSYSEYEQLKKDYEDMELERLDALKTYTQALYSFDRLTCGTVTQLLADIETGYGTGEGGESFVTGEDTSDVSNGAYYYINTIVEDNAFEIGIYIPEDCEVTVDRFELWAGGVMLGERTEVGRTIRHMTLSVENEESVFIRLYGNNSFVTDVYIDASKYRGELPIEVKKKEEPTERRIGSFTYEKNKNTGAVTLKLKINENEKIAYFRISKDGKYILSDEPKSVDSEIKYLSLLEQDISMLTAEFFDANQEKLGEGYLDTGSMSVFIKTGG